MRVNVFWLLLPLVASAGGSVTVNVRELNRWTRVDSGCFAYYGAAMQMSRGGSRASLLVGRLDTVGGTTYDWQTSGPASRRTAYDFRFGTHTAWRASGDTLNPGLQVDARYNFHNGTAWQGNAGPGFMSWGMRVFTNRNSLSSLDVNPVTGCEYLSATTMAVARDVTPGAGCFEVDTAPSGVASHLWPVMALSGTERVHLAMTDYPARTALRYLNIDWPEWLESAVGGFEPAPGYASYNITGSNLNRVCVTWQHDNAGSGGMLPYPAYYRQSWDDGNTWDSPVQLPFPSAFTPVPGETLGASFHISSVTPFFDWHDNLHIVASVFCAKNESEMYYVPVEIWHWSEVEGWSEVVRVTEDSLPRDGSSYGYTAIYATRPTLAGDAAGRLVCVWEQFNCWNTEPQTLRWRADIWGAGSSDNGVIWNAPVRLTDSDETSKRFPSVAEEFKGDSVVIGYEVDLCAGFAVQNEGPVTENPWVVQTVPVSAFGLGMAVAEGEARHRRPGLKVTPNPARGMLQIESSVADAALSVVDCSGRRVRTLATDRHGAAVWDRTDDAGRRVAAGVYFVRLHPGSEEKRCRVVVMGER